MVMAEPPEVPEARKDIGRDWRTMTVAERQEAVREMAHAFGARRVLRRADNPTDDDEVKATAEDLATLDLEDRRRIIVESNGWPRFRLVKRMAKLGHQVLLLQVKPGPARPFQTLGAARVSKKTRVIDAEEP